MNEVAFSLLIVFGVLIGVVSIAAILTMVERRLLALFQDHALLVGEGNRWNITHAGGKGTAPGGFHVSGLQLHQREPDGRLVVDRPYGGEELLCQAVAHYRLVAQTVDERPSDASGDGSNQMHPVRGEPGRQQRRGDQQPP